MAPFAVSGTSPASAIEAAWTRSGVVPVSLVSRTRTAVPDGGDEERIPHRSHHGLWSRDIVGRCVFRADSKCGRARFERFRPSAGVRSGGQGRDHRRSKRQRQKNSANLRTHRVLSPHHFLLCTALRGGDNASLFTARPRPSDGASLRFQLAPVLVGFFPGQRIGPQEKQAKQGRNRGAEAHRDPHAEIGTRSLRSERRVESD
jgi:hypothetical protein